MKKAYLSLMLVCLAPIIGVSLITKDNIQNPNTGVFIGPVLATPTITGLIESTTRV